MRGFTIQARSYDSAQALHSALSEFHPELVGNNDQGYSVSIPLGNTDRELLRLLDAIQLYVIERQTCAHVELDGHAYTIHGEGVPSREQ